MTLPRPFDDAFLKDLPYDPEVLLFDQLMEIDKEKSLVKCRWSTHADMPLTRSQRVHPVLHPQHVAGGLMVHATGMLGFVHAYHIHDLRHHEGWIGYGTHLHKAVFRKLLPPGSVIEATCHATRSRIGKTRHFVRYAFVMTHEGETCYESEQSAMWLKLDPNESDPKAALFA